MAEDLATRMLSRVKEIRLGLGLTQVEFAAKAGLKYKHYQAIEAGRKKDIRFSTLEKLADACQVEPWELLIFPTEPKHPRGKARK